MRWVAGAPEFNRRGRGVRGEILLLCDSLFFMTQSGAEDTRSFAEGLVTLARSFGSLALLFEEFGVRR